MGKIKRERQKYHIVAADKREDEEPKNCETPISKPQKLQLDTVQNIFAGINIQLSDINNFNENVEIAKEPVQNEVMTKAMPKLHESADVASNIPGKHLTKREKMTLKHQKLMEKLDVVQKARLLCQQKKQKQKQKLKNQMNSSHQALLDSQIEVQSLLTPKAVKSSNQHMNEMIPKNVFAIPSFNDDLPALNPINEIQKYGFNIQAKSKSISKKSNTKKNFIRNYNFLKQAMAGKKK